MNGNIYSAALGAKDKSIVSWAEKLMLDVARKSPGYAFTAHLEQSGRQIALQRDGKYQLKAAPFKYDVPIEKLTGKSLDVMVTNSIFLDSIRHIAPHYITLNFK